MPKPNASPDAHTVSEHPARVSRTRQTALRPRFRPQISAILLGGLEQAASAGACGRTNVSCISPASFAVITLVITGATQYPALLASISQVEAPDLASEMCRRQLRVILNLHEVVNNLSRTWFAASRHSWPLNNNLRRTFAGKDDQKASIPWSNMHDTKILPSTLFCNMFNHRMYFTLLFRIQYTACTGSRNYFLFSP